MRTKKGLSWELNEVSAGKFAGCTYRFIVKSTMVRMAVSERGPWMARRIGLTNNCFVPRQSCNEPAPKQGRFRVECVACLGNTGREHNLREMMFGTHKEFVYWECSGCGCLQIATIPEHMGEYYPPGYYSFSMQSPAWKKWYYRAHFAAPRLMKVLRRSSPDIASVIAARPKPGARILDVGCGGGKLVNILRSLGFDAHGIDPFIEAETAYVRRASIEDVQGGWDLIMFHHSLEHMPNHIKVLGCVRSKLGVGGTCLVRIPVATWAWRHYGRDWAQLDAPRHLVIHTPRSFQLTANAAGLELARTIFDSYEFQFWASEGYRRGLRGRKRMESFSRKELQEFRAQADNLNRQQLGDSAAFFLVVQNSKMSNEDS